MYDSISKAPPEELFTLSTDQWTQPFWDAARAHRLVAPRCAACGHFRMPPTPFCPKCHSQKIDWVQLSGKGTVYTWTTVRRAVLPSMAPNIPYVVAVIELPDAGRVRLVSNIIGAALADVRIDAPVRVLWNDRKDGVTLPQFELDR